MKEDIKSQIENEIKKHKDKLMDIMNNRKGLGTWCSDNNEVICSMINFLFEIKSLTAGEQGGYLGELLKYCELKAKLEGIKIGEQLKGNEFTRLKEFAKKAGEQKAQALWDEIKYICDENCYCGDGEGTTFSKTPTSKQCCCFCFILEEIKKRV